MSRPFQAIRSELYANEIGQEMLARRLRISAHTVSRKLNAHTEWTLEECYQVLDLLGRPYTDLPVMFPRGGRNEEGRKCARRR